MCKFYHDKNNNECENNKCKGCELEKRLCYCDIDADPDLLVNTVQQWNMAHQITTNADKIREIFPYFDIDGALPCPMTIDPKVKYISRGKGCLECSKIFGNQNIKKLYRIINEIIYKKGIYKQLWILFY